MKSDDQGMPRDALVKGTRSATGHQVLSIKGQASGPEGQLPGHACPPRLPVYRQRNAIETGGIVIFIIVDIDEEIFLIRDILSVDGQTPVIRIDTE